MYYTVMTYFCYLKRNVEWKLLFERNSRRIFGKCNPGFAELSILSCLVKTVIVSSVMWQHILSLQDFKIFFNSA